MLSMWVFKADSDIFRGNDFILGDSLGDILGRFLLPDKLLELVIGTDNPDILIPAHTGARRYDMADDHVLLESLQGIDLYPGQRLR